MRMGGSLEASQGYSGLVFASVAWAGFCRAPGAQSCELPFHWVVAACVSVAVTELLSVSAW